jgi:hypothetical protein
MEFGLDTKKTGTKPVTNALFNVSVYLFQLFWRGLRSYQSALWLSTSADTKVTAILVDTAITPGIVTMGAVETIDIMVDDVIAAAVNKLSIL